MNFKDLDNLKDEGGEICLNNTRINKKSSIVDFKFTFL